MDNEGLTDVLWEWKNAIPIGLRTPDLQISVLPVDVGQREISNLLGAKAETQK
jgi:hypothetical protein